MSDELNLEAAQAHHGAAVDKILKVLIDETAAAGGDQGEMMNILVSVIACTVLNLFREEAVANTLAEMNRHLLPRLDMVREQNAETIARLEEETVAALLKKDGRLN